jgi:hypothetical protein
MNLLCLRSQTASLTRERKKRETKREKEGGVVQTAPHSRFDHKTQKENSYELNITVCQWKGGQ